MDRAGIEPARRGYHASPRFGFTWVATPMYRITSSVLTIHAADPFATDNALRPAFFQNRCSGISVLLSLVLSLIGETKLKM